MRKDLSRFIPVLFVIFAIALLAGCQDTASEKQMRLVAVENEQLKTQLSECNLQLTQKDGEILKVQEDNKEISEQLGSKLEESMSDVMVMLSEENERLQKENLDLKAKIEELSPK